MLPSSFKQKIEEGWDAFTSQINGVQFFPMTLTRQTRFHEIGPQPIPSCIEFHYGDDSRTRREPETDKEESNIEPERSLFHDMTINASSSRSSLKSRESRHSHSLTHRRSQSRSPTSTSPSRSRSPSKIPARVKEFYSERNNNVKQTPSAVIAAPMAVKVNPSVIFVTNHGTDSNQNLSSHSPGIETMKVVYDQKPKLPSSLPAMYESKPELSLGRKEKSLFPTDNFRETGHSSFEELSDIRISSSRSSKLREENVNLSNAQRHPTSSRDNSRADRPVDALKLGNRRSATSHGNYYGNFGNDRLDRISRNVLGDSNSNSNTSMFESEKYRNQSSYGKSYPAVSYKNDTDEDLNARLQELINRRGRHQESYALSRRRSNDLLVRHHSSNTGRVRRRSSYNRLSDVHSKSVPRFGSRQLESNKAESAKRPNSIGIWKSSELLNFAYHNVLEIRGAGVKDGRYLPADSSRRSEHADSAKETTSQLKDVVKRLESIEQTVADLAKSHKSQSQKLQDILSLMGQQESRYDLTMNRLDDVTALVSTALDEIKEIKTLESQMLKMTSSQVNQSYRNHVQHRCSNTAHKKVTFKGINDR